MIEWIKRTLSNGMTGEPSTKRSIVAIAAITLCGVTLMVGVASAFWVRTHGDLGSGAVAALSLMAGITAGLAGNAYRKLESVPPTLASDGSAPMGAATVGATVPSPLVVAVVSGSSTDAAGGLA